MAGHSKFKNIMHRKGAQDKKRSAMFSKLSREITVAAKSGMPDPDMNPRLRLAVNNAKAQSMPKDNIQRAIDKASANEGDAQTLFKLVDMLEDDDDVQTVWGNYEVSDAVMEKLG